MALNSFNKALINVYTDSEAKKMEAERRGSGNAGTELPERAESSKVITLHHLRGLLLYARIKH